MNKQTLPNKALSAQVSDTTLLPKQPKAYNQKKEKQLITLNS
jgi:hypothetical protein